MHNVTPAIKRTAAFRTRCIGASVLVGKPASTALQETTLDSMKANARRCADAVSAQRHDLSVNSILYINEQMSIYIYIYIYIYAHL